MAVDTLQAAPGLLPITSLTTALGEYDVIGVLPPEATGTPLRVRNRDTGEQAELRFLSGPAPDMRDVEKSAVWEKTVAGWTQALRAVTELGAHPHIQHILDFGETEGGFYVLLEPVEGRTLRQALQEDGPRPLEWLLPIYAKVASALDFTAAHHIHHANLSLDSVVLSDAQSRVCLRGLGLSSLHRKSVTIFTSPEQAAGQPADTRSDIYAVGAMLYTCLSGRPPFAASSREDLCRKIQSSVPAPLIGQPEWTRDIVARAMQRVPEHRYRVAVDIINDLTYRRSPAPLKDDAVDPTFDNDCSLGRYMPEMALKADRPEAAFHEKEADGPGLLSRLLTRLLPLSRRQGQEEIADPFPDLLTEAGDPDGEGKPITRGFLGRFNRYMALQDYVFLAPDDPTRRGWRGLLRRLGLYHPAPNPDAARRRRWQLAPRLAKRLEVAWRRTRRVAVAATLLLAFHAQKLIGDQGHATISNVKGQASIILQGGPELPMQEQATLSGDEQPVLITRMGMADVQLSDSRLRLDPNSRVQVGQMNYQGGAVRKIHLLQGRVEVEVNPQDIAGGHYDVECNGIQIRALPTSGSPESNGANQSDKPNSANNSNGSVVFALTAKPNGVQVQVARGQVRMYSSPSKRFVRAGSQLAATKGKSLSKPTAMNGAALKSLLAQHRMDGDKSGLIAAALESIRHLYMGTQEKMFMPSLDKSLAVLHLRPGNPLEEASRNIVARTALDALGKAVSSMQDLPEKINCETLAELDLDAAGRQNLLQSLDGHRLLAYRPLGNSSYIILARMDNEAKTLLQIKDGTVSAIPEDKEEAAFAEANAQ